MQFTFIPNRSFAHFAMQVLCLFIVISQVLSPMFLPSCLDVLIHHPFQILTTMVYPHPRGVYQMEAYEVHAKKTGVDSWNTQHQGPLLNLKL